MAIGDLGSIIASLEVYANYGRTPQPIRVGANMYALVFEGLASDGYIKTIGVNDEGTIAAVTDTFEFETGNCGEPEIIHIAGTTYAVVYQGVDSDGWLATVDIGTDGEITEPILGSLEFETGVCLRPSIVHVDGLIYTIAYPQYYTFANDNRLLVLDAIAGVTDADIGKVVAGVTTGDTGTLVSYDATLKRLVVHPDAAGDKFDDDDEEITVDGVTAGNMTQTSKTGGWRGYITTVTISADGATLSVVDTGAFDTGYNGEYPHIIHIAGTVYAIAHTRGDEIVSGDVGAGIVRTINIADVGTIGAAIDSTAIDTSGGSFRIVKVGNDVYAIVYKYRDTYSIIKMVSVTISSAGAISSVLDTQEIATTSHAGSATVRPDIVAISGTVVMVAYSDTGANTIKTYTVDAAGAITDTAIDSLVYDTVSYGRYPRLIRIETESIYMVVYTDSGTDGMAKTFGVTVPATYPTDDITRVTGIRHIYRPGFFRMQLMLGDVSNTIEIAEARVKKELEIPEDQTPPTPKEPIPPYEPGPYWAPEPPPGIIEELLAPTRLPTREPERWPPEMPLPQLPGRKELPALPGRTEPAILPGRQEPAQWPVRTEPAKIPGFLPGLVERYKRRWEQLTGWLRR